MAARMRGDAVVIGVCTALLLWKIDTNDFRYVRHSRGPNYYIQQHALQKAQGKVKLTLCTPRKLMELVEL